MSEARAARVLTHWQKAFRDTVDFEHIKLHYYGSHRVLNGTGIIPIGPGRNFEEPSSRFKPAAPMPQEH